VPKGRPGKQREKRRFKKRRGQKMGEFYSGRKMNPDSGFAKAQKHLMDAI
jgi:hypothetical protein